MGYWAVYKIVSGNVVERYKAWKSGAPRAKRGSRTRGSSGLKKAEANRQGAVRRAARVLNANYSHADFFLTLNYDDAHLPADWESHERDRRLLLERIKKHCRKLGLAAPRVFSMCSDRDGKTGEQERRHVHVVISGAGISFRDGKWYLGEGPLERIWGKGGVYAEQLWDQADYTGLAAYLLRQARTDKADWKAYHTSRNMIRPEPVEETALTGRELRAPKGSVVIENHYDARCGSAYIRYVRPGKRSERAGNTDRCTMTGAADGKRGGTQADGSGTPRRTGGRKKQ